MPLFRIIPSLLLRNREIVKGRSFKNHTYVGDPINTIRIFNENGADELVLFGINIQNTGIDYTYLERIAGECFMPLTYGGGIQKLDNATRLFDLGIEKISICTAAVENPQLVEKLATKYGSQSIAVCIDYRTLSDETVATHCGKRFTQQCPIALAKEMQDCGAGEIIIQNVGKDGSGESYDFDTLARIKDAISLPILISGGAGSRENIAEAKQKGASGAIAGSLFTYYGPHRAVLINYPEFEEREALDLNESV